MNLDLLLLLFFILGALTSIGVYEILKLKNKYVIYWYNWLLLASGLSLLVFSIAWAISSVIEFENQAAGVGLLIFGGMALVCFSIATKLISKKGNEKL